MTIIARSGIFEYHDPRFFQLVVGSAALDTLATGLRWAEGPVWFSDRNALLFSDIPNQRIMQWTDGGVGVFRAPSNFANGHRNCPDIRWWHGREHDCDCSGRECYRYARRYRCAGNQ